MYDVIIATYNGEHYIIEQIESIVFQTVKPMAIYIRDDMSTDDSLHLIKNYIECYKGDIDFILVESDVNLGYVKNFECLVRRTKSNIVFFCDQDDIWISNKAELFLNKFKSNPLTQLIFSNAFLVDESLNQIGMLWDKVRYQHQTDEISMSRLIQNNVVTGATMACKRDFLIEALPFPSDIPHDYWLSMYAALKKTISPYNKGLIKYRQHANNQIGINKTSIAKKILTPFNPNKIKFRLQHYQVVASIHMELSSRFDFYSNSYIYKEVQEFLEIINLIYCCKLHLTTRTEGSSMGLYKKTLLYYKYNNVKNLLNNIADFVSVRLR